MTAPPADASALAASLLRPPVSGPGLREIGLSQPAGAPASGSTADSGTEPFAALLLGFLQGAQPAALAIPASVALLDKAVTDELPVPDTLADSNGMSATLPITAAVPQPATAALSALADGRALPAGGSSLPPTTAESFTGKASCFLSMCIIVNTKADYILTRMNNRCQQLYFRKLDCSALQNVLIISQVLQLCLNLRRITAY